MRIAAAAHAAATFLLLTAASAQTTTSLTVPSTSSSSVALSAYKFYSFTAASTAGYTVTVTPSSGDADLACGVTAPVSNTQPLLYTQVSSTNSGTAVDSVTIVYSGGWWSLGSTIYCQVRGFQAATFTIKVVSGTPSTTPQPTVSASATATPTRAASIAPFATTSLAVGASIRASVATSSRLFFAVPWSGALQGLDIQLTPLTSGGDPDLYVFSGPPGAAPLYDMPSPMVSSLLGSGRTDAVSLTASGSLLSAVGAGGTVYIAVYGALSSSFSLSVSVLSSTPSPTPTRAASTPLPVEVRQNLTGESAYTAASFSSSSDSYHWYTYAPPANVTGLFEIVLRRTSSSGDPDLCANTVGFAYLSASDSNAGTSVNSCSGRSGGNDDIVTLNLVRSSSGQLPTAYIRVKNYSGSPSYSLTISRTGTVDGSNAPAIGGIVGGVVGGGAAVVIIVVAVVLTSRGCVRARLTRMAELQAQRRQPPPVVRNGPMPAAAAVAPNAFGNAGGGGATRGGMAAIAINLRPGQQVQQVQILQAQPNGLAGGLLAYVSPSLSQRWRNNNAANAGMAPPAAGGQPPIHSLPQQTSPAAPPPQQYGQGAAYPPAGAPLHSVPLAQLHAGRTDGVYVQTGVPVSAATAAAVAASTTASSAGSSGNARVPGGRGGAAEADADENPADALTAEDEDSGAANVRRQGSARDPAAADGDASTRDLPSKDGGGPYGSGGGGNSKAGVAAPAGPSAYPSAPAEADPTGYSVGHNSGYATAAAGPYGGGGYYGAGYGAPPPVATYGAYPQLYAGSAYPQPQLYGGTGAYGGAGALPLPPAAGAAAPAGPPGGAGGAVAGPVPPPYRLWQADL